MDYRCQILSNIVTTYSSQNELIIFPMFPFDLPENNRKRFSDVFRGSKGSIGKKWVESAPQSILLNATV